MDQHSVSYTEISKIILDGGNWVFDRESNRVIRDRCYMTSSGCEVGWR